MKNWDPLRVFKSLNLNFKHFCLPLPHHFRHCLNFQSFLIMTPPLNIFSWFAEIFLEIKLIENGNNCNWIINSSRSGGKSERKKSSWFREFPLNRRKTCLRFGVFLQFFKNEISKDRNFHIFRFYNQKENFTRKYCLVSQNSLCQINEWKNCIPPDQEESPWFDKLISPWSGGILLIWV